MRKKLPQPRVVLWDVDGVLIDSEPLHYQKLFAVTKKYGIILEEQDFTAEQRFTIPDGDKVKEVCMPLGGAGDKNIYHWAVHQKPSLKEALPMNGWLDELLEHFIANKGMLKPRAGIIPLIEALDQNGVMQGVVTSGVPKQVEANLSVLSSHAMKFAFVLTANDVTRSKPDPEGYLIGKRKAESLLTMQQKNSGEPIFVAVEDSVPGVRAALAAQIACVQYLLPGHKPMTVHGDEVARYSHATKGEQVSRKVYAALRLAR